MELEHGSLGVKNCKCQNIRRCAKLWINTWLNRWRASLVGKNNVILMGFQSSKFPDLPYVDSFNFCYIVLTIHNGFTVSLAFLSVFQLIQTWVHLHNAVRLIRYAWFQLSHNSHQYTHKINQGRAISYKCKVTQKKWVKYSFNRGLTNEYISFVSDGPASHQRALYVVQAWLECDIISGIAWRSTLLTLQSAQEEPLTMSTNHVPASPIWKTTMWPEGICWLNSSDWRADDGYHWALNSHLWM